ncbi:MAG TPA: hypothetical protein VF940_31715 [Streptosporangiaceae bacterium]
MLVLIRSSLVRPIAMAVILTAVLGPAGIARAAAGGSGSCYPVNLTWICVYSGGGGGRPGSGGGSSTITCTFTKAPPRVLRRMGTGPPAPGYRWDIMTCPGSNTGPLGGQLVQVSTKTGAPAISPAYLLKIGVGALSVPTLAAATAPPRGRDGLVGLPEWYWVPRAQWHPVSMTVRAGPVWAVATAIPTMLSYVPGGGMGSVSCPGPGAAFNRALPAAQQQTRCSYTYTRPSKGQPGDAFQAGLFVRWTVSWTGSGGAGGLITSSYATGNGFTVRIAQAEALVTTP